MSKFSLWCALNNSSDAKIVGDTITSWKHLVQPRQSKPPAKAAGRKSLRNPNSFSLKLQRSFKPTGPGTDLLPDPTPLKSCK